LALIRLRLDKRNIYIVNDIVNNMDNTKIITNAIKKEENGLSITELVNKTPLSRGQIRTALAFLLGAGFIIEKQAGMTKLYFIKGK